MFGCKDVICKPCCSDVIEHKVRHRCNMPIATALVLCAMLIAQMLLSMSILYGTDVVVPLCCSML